MKIPYASSHNHFKRAFPKYDVIAFSRHHGITVASLKCQSLNVLSEAMQLMLVSRPFDVKTPALSTTLIVYTQLIHLSAEEVGSGNWEAGMKKKKR